MRKMAFLGSLTYSGANLANSLLSAVTNSIIGSLTYCSKCGLRGWNHSRRLLRFRLRKKVVISVGNPEKLAATMHSFILWLDARPERNHRASKQPSQFSDLRGSFAEPAYALRDRRPGGGICRDRRRA